MPTTISVSPHRAGVVSACPACPPARLSSRAHSLSRRRMLTLARRCLKPTQTAAFRTMTTSKTYEELTASADQEQLEFMKEMVIQVDEQDNVVGPLSKKDAHFGEGILHRAFSVFLFNEKNELMLQKRTKEKITFPSIWSNTCCSHPLFVQDEMEPGLGVKRAAIRKLEHELGIPTSTLEIKDLRYVSTVLYKAASDEFWTEFEVDHILLARASNIKHDLNENEVEAIEYIRRDELATLFDNTERNYSPWFKIVATRLLPTWWDNLDAVLAQDEPERKVNDFRE